MTPAAAVLIIVVGAGEAGSPATTALVATASESLGPSTSIRVREIPKPTDADALRMEAEMGADAVVLVVWKGNAHLAALLRLHVARTDRSITRAIAFTPQDALFERGRTLGFAIASMWPESGMAQAPSARPAPPPAAVPATEAAPPVTPAEPRTPPASAPEKPAPPPAVTRPEAVTLSRPEPVRAPAAARAHRFWIGLAAEGAMGVGGPASGLGAAVEGLVFVSRNLSLRLAGSVRGGNLPELPGSHLVGGLAFGCEWWPIAAGNGNRWSLGVRADALALWHRVRDAGAGGQAETHGRFLPGADLVVRGMLRLGSSMDLVLGAGPEMALGATEVRQGSERTVVATIPALRLLAEAGFRVGF